MRKAKWLPRLGAIIIDLLLLLLVEAVLPFHLLHQAASESETPGPVWNLFARWEALVIGPAYFVGCRYWARGQTLGKRALGLRTVRLDGSRLTFVDAVVDCLGYVIWPFDVLIGVVFSPTGGQRF